LTSRKAHRGKRPQTSSARSPRPVDVPPQPALAGLEGTGLRILGEIIASLEQCRDSHKTELDLAIQRLRTTRHFAEKAIENSQVPAPKVRAPHVVGGYLVV
jgi:hypothetical protein